MVPATDLVSAVKAEIDGWKPKGMQNKEGTIPAPLDLEDRKVGRLMTSPRAALCTHLTMQFLNSIFLPNP